MNKEYTINSFKVTKETTIEFAKNPKRPGFKSFGRYEEYMSATTIGEYFEIAEKKYSKADLRYDEEHGHLSIFNEDGECVNLAESE